MSFTSPKPAMQRCTVRLPVGLHKRAMARVRRLERTGDYPKGAKVSFNAITVRLWREYLRG